MKKQTSIAITVILVMAVGCVNSTARWEVAPPDTLDSPWARTLPSLTFSNTPLPIALAELERSANAIGKHPVSLRVVAHDQSEPEPPRITFRAEQIPLKDALQILGEVTGYRPVYRMDKAVLARARHADGQAPVIVRGHCRASQNGAPVLRFSLVCTRQAMIFDDEQTKTLYDIVTTKDGSFSIPVLVSAYSEVTHVDDRQIVSDDHPNPQCMQVVAIADSYSPTRLAVDLNESNLTYTVDIEMDR